MGSLGRQTNTLKRLRSFLLVILVLTLLGTGAELLLVGHFEEVWQWIPLVLIPLALLVLGLLAASRKAALVRIWQALMILFLISGVTGLGLHWKGKMEFKRESDPSLTGWKLFREAMQTESPPALAPGVMIQMGLLGLAYAFRHPALAARSNDGLEEKGEHE